MLIDKTDSVIIIICSQILYTIPNNKLNQITTQPSLGIFVYNSGI